LFHHFHDRCTHDENLLIVGSVEDPNSTALRKAGGPVFFLVVEAEKLVIRSSGGLRRSVTAVEAGA
jgi:hypothetical protein